LPVTTYIKTRRATFFNVDGGAEAPDQINNMIPSKLTPAAWLLLLGTASAAPATETETTAPAAAATLADTATDTGAAQPVPTNELGASAFAPCSNTDGEFKPFCLPKQHDIFYPGSTPYGKLNPTPPPIHPQHHPSTNLKPPIQ
jgi:hypothetical protein